MLSKEAMICSYSFARFLKSARRSLEEAMSVTMKEG